MTGAIILAAGKGTRFGSWKQFEMVEGKSILNYAIESYLPFVDAMNVVIPGNKEFVIYDYKQKILEGGETRYDSMLKGYKFMGSIEKCDKILIVDAVRCNTSERIIKELIKALDDYDYAFPMLKSVNTACRLIDGDFAGVHNKLDMYDIQTPTAMKREVIERIIEYVEDDPKKKEFGFSFVYMALQAGVGFKCRMVNGDPANIKITYPIDIEIFKALLNRKQQDKVYGLYEAPTND